MFVSILEYYYDILCKDKFESIFGNIYIGKNPTPLVNSFRILKFDFSGIDTRNKKSSEEGYTDVEMYIRPNNIKTHHQYVIEVKYIKKDSEKSFETVRAEATTQLKHYLQTDMLLQSKKMLHPLVVIFVKDALFWEEIAQ